MKIQLSDHFTLGKLLKFTISPILMMIFTTIYSIVDGIFTSNFAGKEANEVFSFLTYFTIGTGVLLSLAGWFAVPVLAKSPFFTPGHLRRR